MREREIFGFLGPNGAGKTTTIKILMGLLRPSTGRAMLFGLPAGDMRAKRRIGYLPESPYFYDHLSAREYLDLVGRLFGLGGAERRRRSDELLDRVGLFAPRTRPMRGYSKGMLQRVGLAQALIGDPELVVLDEPMSGLDPIGRKEVRDIIAALRDEGRTVFFCTHILSDAELLCDRVAIIVKGRVREMGPLGDLVEPRVLSVEIVYRGSERLDSEMHAKFTVLAASSPGAEPGAEGGEKAGAESGSARGQVPPRLERTSEGTTLRLPNMEHAQEAIALIVAHGGELLGLHREREGLEDVFVRDAAKAAGEARD